MIDGFMAIGIIAALAIGFGVVHFIRSRTRTQIRIEFEKQSYAMGEPVVATVNVRPRHSLKIDEAVIRLLCEEQSSFSDDNGDEGRRSLFSKSRELSRKLDLSHAQPARFSCSMALPQGDPQDVKGIFTLTDMARIMRCQLNGEGVPSRRKSDRPNGRFSQMMTRFHMGHVKWRLEITFRHRGEIVLTHREDVPVYGFADLADCKMGDAERNAA